MRTVSLADEAVPKVGIVEDGAVSSSEAFHNFDFLSQVASRPEGSSLAGAGPHRHTHSPHRYPLTSPADWTRDALPRPARPRAAEHDSEPRLERLFHSSDRDGLGVQGRRRLRTRNEPPNEGADPAP
jgi:hypothetical protein